MLEAPGTQQILDKAREREEEYKWLEAAESYSKVLNLLSDQDPSKIGEVHERLGHALHRASMQAETQDEFIHRTSQSAQSYDKASELFNRMNRPGKSLRCRATTAYLGFWLAAEAAQKKRLLDESWRLAKEALKTFRDAGNAHDHAVTYNQLSTSAGLGLCLEWDFDARKRVTKEAIDLGEQAIQLLSPGDSGELVTACVRTASFLGAFGTWFFDLDESEIYHQRARGHWKRALEISEETALHELATTFPLEVPTDWDMDRWIQWTEKELDYRMRTKDKFVTGWVLDWSAFGTFWKVNAVEDPDEKLRLARKALEYAEQASREHSIISFMSPRPGTLWVKAPHPEHYWQVAFIETDLGARRSLLEKALRASPEMLKRAEDSGYPNTIGVARHVFSKILADLAKLETRPEEKKRLLEEALEHRTWSIRIFDELQPFDYWSRGVYQNYLAEIKAELFGLGENIEAKTRLVREAVQDKETGLKLCIKQIEFWERSAPSPASHAVIGRWQYEYGDLLTSLQKLTSEKDDLRHAARAFEEAAHSFQKPNLLSRMAECYWKAAETYDSLDEHLEAAESFSLASGHYHSSAAKIPQLSELYEDHAVYMRAWSEIEKARHYHVRQEYNLAREHYEKAANLHKSTRRWSYLTPNYSAWAQVENAEDLSRRELSKEATEAFEEAARLFDTGRGSLQATLSRIENLEEKQMVTKLVKAADLRQEYCLGRIALEEARVLDRRGDHYSSSEKYGHASESFQRIAQTVESEQARDEFSLIITLAKAWQSMTQAEASDRPELYLEASRLFEGAKEFSTTERSTLLVSGHSRFCKALEAGSRFADTRENPLHSAAVKHLESAANYYLKAGFQNDAEYARASKLLLDAYVYMDEADGEKDNEKKAKLYVMAERVLQASASSYEKALYAGKKEQVLGLLEKVKKERELALSLTEVLRAPSILSATAAFSTPAPIHERAVGLERFEHADIQASVITRPNTMKLGQTIDVEIELVNAGKGPAQLIKLEELIPEGFELTKKPEPYGVEDRYLNMKGKKLDPLKTEEVKLVIKPRVQGRFALKPRVLYLDEGGRYRSHEPDPVEVTVQDSELPQSVTGIVEPVIQVPAELRFENERSRLAFHYLVREFTKDYMSRRIYMEKAGWRSLMDLIRELKLPRSAVYGAAGRKGPALAGLERRGLVETRIFPEERGRGGEILKVRVAYENAVVKDLVQQSVMKGSSEEAA